VKFIYQAQPMTDKFVSRADILVKEKNGWHLYEVKSSTDIKPEHISDLRFQVIVFREFGVNIKKIFLIHINKDYTYSERKGLEIRKFLTTEDVTDIVTDNQDNEIKHMRKAHKILTSKIEPKPAVLKRKFKYPMSEKMEEYYWKGIPDYSIYDISGITPKKLAALEARGIMKIKDVPDNFPLSANQMNQVIMTKEKRIKVNKKLLAKEFEKFKFPIWFFDYEALQLAIPIIDGLHPWEQLPMQYSLYKLDKKEKLTHYEFLYQGKKNPLPGLLKTMKKQLGEKGTVFSWNASFEKSRNKEMAELMPKYRNFLLGVNRRTYDIMQIFKNIYRDYRFKGSSSLKVVLPVLVPSLSYNVLQIHGGEETLNALYDLFFGYDKNPAKTRKHLLEYCKLDTLAMVEIYEYLKKKIQL